jgi:hypothetical protein
VIALLRLQALFCIVVQASFQEVVDAAGRTVAQEFEAVMAALEDRRRGLAERATRTREAIAMVNAQVPRLLLALLSNNFTATCNDAAGGDAKGGAHASSVTIAPNGRFPAGCGLWITVSADQDGAACRV